MPKTNMCYANSPAEPVLVCEESKKQPHEPISYRCNEPVIGFDSDTKYGEHIFHIH
jgi:hypothetical protein